MGAFEFDKKALLQELEILLDPLYQEERAVLLELVRSLQRANTDDDYMQLQIKLIARAKARQQIATELEEDRERLRAEIADLAGQDPKPLDEIKELQRQLGVRHRQRRVSEALRWIVLTIGDAMVWKLLDYDRAAISILAQGPRVARFADSPGFDAEISVIEQQWNHGVLAIHNDLTTCLRHGDVTTVNREEGSVCIVEVKRSHEPTDESPQVKRIIEATALINEGRREPEDGRPVNVHRIGLRYRTFLSNLGALITKAKRDGYAAAKAGACQFVEVIRFDVGLMEEQPIALRSNARTGTGWFKGDTATFEWGWTKRRMRDRRHSFGALAPLPLLPLPAEDVTDLAMGYMDVMVTLNVGCLAQAFRAKGIDVEIALPPQHGVVFLQAKKLLNNRELTIQVGPQLREQMLSELMTPSNVVAAVESLIEIMFSRDFTDERREEEHVVALADERRTWTP